MGIACKYKKNEEGGEEGKNCYLNFKTKENFYIGACPWFNFCENLFLQFWVFLLCLSGTCNLFLVVKDFSNATHFSFLKWLTL